MKKLSALFLAFVMCFSLIVNVSAAASVDGNNTNIALSSGLRQALQREGININTIELVSVNVTQGEDTLVDDNMGIGTVLHETVYRYVDTNATITRAANVYIYINDWTVESWLYDTKTLEEHARGYVSGNFRYNKEAQEAKCLSTNAGKISAQSGYTVTTTHKTNNATESQAGAYGEVKFSWGLWSSKTDKISISCDYNGNVSYTSTN